ncbi:MAG: AAA family ATPase, partial [Myxococcales bacterium]|nr:AAA family ATPase [Myxococcales bacterium]
MARVSPLAPPQLRAACPDGALDFETTDELEDLIGVIGQDRALEAFDVGLGIRREGYNIVIVGSQGVGKHTVARAALTARAAKEPCPPDLCYVFNFAEPHRPLAVTLPAGKGGRFRSEMEKVVEDLRMILQVVFTSDRYSQRVRRIVEAMEKVQEQSLDAIKKVAADNGLAVEDSEDGFAYGPEQDGAIMPPEDFDKLEEAQREKYDSAMADVEDRLQALTAAVPRWRKETRDRLKSLEQEVTREEVGRLLGPLKDRWKDVEPVAAWLDALSVDIVKEVHLFRDHEESEEGPPGPPMLNHGAASLKRYAVNLLVDSGRCEGAPVVYEDNPVLTNLVGRIEHVSEYGALVTDHTLIKPGALHHASGGYLILDAHRVLGEPFAWTALKRALRARLLRMDAPSHEATLQTTVSLAPEPVPIDVKV